MATGLPNISARGGTQDQPLHPPPLGRPKRSVPRTQTHPDRHPGPSQRHQPRPPGQPGPAHRNRGLGNRLTPPSTPSQGSIFRCRRGQNSNVADTNPTKGHYISAVLGAVRRCRTHQYSSYLLLDELADSWPADPNNCLPTGDATAI